METLHKSHWVPYSREKMYGLVADIARYPQFLPWCTGARVIRDLGASVEASLTLSQGPVSKSFVTRNLMQPFEQIEMHLVSGPFKHLYGVWRFTEQDGGTLIHFELEFSFSSRLIAMMIGPLFNTAANTLLDAFVARAKQVCTSP